MNKNLEEKRTRLFDLLSIAMKYPAMRVKIASMSSFFSTQTRNELSLFGDSIELEAYIEDILVKFLEIDKKELNLGIFLMEITRTRLNEIYNKMEFRDLFSKHLTQNGKLQPPLLFADFVFASVSAIAPTSVLLKEYQVNHSDFRKIGFLSPDHETESSPWIDLGYVLVHNIQKYKAYQQREVFTEDFPEEIFVDARA